MIPSQIQQVGFAASAEGVRNLNISHLQDGHDYFNEVVTEIGFLSDVVMHRAMEMRTPCEFDTPDAHL